MPALIGKLVSLEACNSYRMDNLDLNLNQFPVLRPIQCGLAEATYNIQSWQIFVVFL